MTTVGKPMITIFKYLKLRQFYLIFDDATVPKVDQMIYNNDTTDHLYKNVCSITDFCIIDQDLYISLLYDFGELGCGTQISYTDYLKNYIHIDSLPPKYRFVFELTGVPPKTTVWERLKYKFFKV